MVICRLDVHSSHCHHLLPLCSSPVHLKPIHVTGHCRHLLGLHACRRVVGFVGSWQVVDYMELFES